MQTLINVFCQTIAVLVVVLLIYIGKKLWKFLSDYGQEESDDNNTDNR